MARTVRDASLGSREARLSLKAGQRHWRGIHEGLALCYRRGGQGSGTWSVRLRLSNGAYALRSLGSADDYADANGHDVLTFKQAQKRAIEQGELAKRDEGAIISPATVKEAADKYMRWFREHRRSAEETERTINAHILPAFGNRRIASIRAPEIRAWLEALAAQPARLRTSRFGTEQRFKTAPKTANEKRARRATANRILNVLKAILNRAFADGLAPDDVEWRKVKPFPKVDEARIRFLTDAEAERLVNACPADLRALVRAALLTGCRYGELTGMKAMDVDLRGARVYVADSKSGRPRHVSLNDEGLNLFRELLVGKTGEDRVFTRANGKPWGKNHHDRPLKEACEVAKVRPLVKFHELRHTYASRLAQSGVSMKAISLLLGHADTRITEKHYAHIDDATLAAAVKKLPRYSTDKREKLQAVTKD